MLLVACPLTAAVAQTPRCDTLPAFQREFARTTGACRDLAPIIDVAPPKVEAAPPPAPAVPEASTETSQTTVSPQPTRVAPQRTEPRKLSSKAAAGSAKSTAPSKTTASRKSEGERRNEPLDASGWKTYQDDRYAFRHPAHLVTTSQRTGVVELHSPDREFRMRASARTNSKKDTLQSAWQQRLKEHGRSVTYKRKGDGWFVVSGAEGGKTYYRKHFVSPDRTAELVITYPKSRSSVYDAWVTEMEKSFIAYRASDSAQDSSSGELPSVVANAPVVNDSRELPNPATPAASVAPAPQLQPSAAPAQKDRVADAFISGTANNVVAALVAGVLLGLLVGAVLMRRALLARSRDIDAATAKRVDIAPAEVESSQATAELHAVAATEPPPEIKFTAWLELGETTIEFADLLEEEEAALEYARDQYAE